MEKGERGGRTTLGPSTFTEASASDGATPDNAAQHLSPSTYGVAMDSILAIDNNYKGLPGSLVVKQDGKPLQEIDKGLL